MTPSPVVIEPVNGAAVGTRSMLSGHSEPAARALSPIADASLGEIGARVIPVAVDVT